MANPTLVRSQGHSEQGVSHLYLEFATTTSGAVGVIARQNEFRVTTPVVRNSAGNYDLFLKEAWVGKVIDCGITVKSNDATAAKAYAGHLAVDSSDQATPKVTILMKRSDTIAAADVADGASIIVRLTLKNN